MMPGTDPGQRNAGEGHAVAQRIAGADLDADAALLGKVHQLRGKRHHKTIKVRARDVLKVAAGTDAVVQRRAHNAQYLSIAWRRVMCIFLKMW